MSCIKDFDCPANAICMVNASWFNAAQYDEPCICDSYYGFSGELFPAEGGKACNEVFQTHASRFWIVTACMLIPVTTALACYSARELARLMRYKMFTANPQTVGNLQVLLGSLLAIVGQCGHLTSALLPERSFVVKNVPFGDKENEHSAVWKGVTGLAAVSLATSTVSISLMWLEVARRCERMQVTDTMLSRNKLIMALQAVFAVFILISVGMGNDVIMFAGSYVLEVVVFGLYTYGNIRIHRVLRVIQSGSKSETDSLKYKVTMVRMQKSTLLICACVLGGLAASTLLIVANLTGWKNYAQPGTVSMQIWAMQLMNTSILMAGFEVSRFLSNSTSERMKRQIDVVSAMQFPSKVIGQLSPSVVVRISSDMRSNNGM